MSFFLTIREQSRRELATLVARDGLRTTSAKIQRVPVEVVVAACDGERIDLTSRQRVEDFVAHVNGRRADHAERSERSPSLPKVRLTRWMTDEVSRAVAQGYIDLAGNGAIAAGAEAYVPGSGGPVPSGAAPADRSAPSRSVESSLARATRTLSANANVTQTNQRGVSQRETI